MAEKKTPKNEVQSGGEAENKPTKKTAKKETSKKDSPEGKKTPSKKSKAFEENVIRDSETAKKRGAKGGKKSGEVRRAKRDARETAIAVLQAMSKSDNVIKNLDNLGLKPEEHSNLAAMFGKLLTMSMGGDLEAFKLFMQFAGYDPEENRKERESLSSEQRKNIEAEAKVNAIGGNIDNASFALSMNDEDGNNDVMIYLPEIKKEEDCEVREETAETDGEASEGGS